MSDQGINNRVHQEALERIRVVGIEHGVSHDIVERIIEAYESAKAYLEPRNE